jgi:predicted Zn-dependent protease
LNPTSNGSGWAGQESGAAGFSQTQPGWQYCRERWVDRASAARNSGSGTSDASHHRKRAAFSLQSGRKFEGACKTTFDIDVVVQQQSYRYGHMSLKSGAFLKLWLLALLSTLSSPMIADDIALPDIGLSASAGIPEQDEDAYARQLLRAMRNSNVLLEDPLLVEFLRTLANRLTEVSDKPEQRFTMVWIKDPSINAFATPGGLIGVHTGLLESAGQESQFASVISHEIAHVTQKHVVRAIERSQKAQIPILLATLAAMALARDGDDQLGVFAAGQGAMQQLQINFTRENEFEADRLGIRTLARAGYDVRAMSRMFGLLQRQYPVTAQEQLPEYIRTHPLSITRISEAKSRAEELARSQTNVIVNTSHYDWMRARASALTSGDLSKQIQQWQDETQASRGNDALRYGLAVAALVRDDGPKALRWLDGLKPHPSNELALLLARAEAQRLSGQAAWRATFDSLNARFPNHRVVVLSYATALLQSAKRADASKAVELIRPTLARNAQDPAFFEMLGRAYELSGDEIRSGEAFARAAALRGAYQDALLQLQALLDRRELDYYQRARIDSQIAALTPIVIALRERFQREQL